MVRVRCIVCGAIGYTASPERALCGCGGRLKVARENEEKPRAKTKEAAADETTASLFETAQLIE